MKTLELFAAGGKAHFQFEAIVALEILALEILAGAIERDKSRRFDRQALLRLVALSIARRTVTVPCSGATASRMAGSGPAVQSGRMLV
jgi:hypothetical protein